MGIPKSFDAYLSKVNFILTHASQTSDSLNYYTWCSSGRIQCMAWIVSSYKRWALCILCRLSVVLAMGLNSQVSSVSGSTRNRSLATYLTTRKTWTIGNGPVLPATLWHFKFTMLALIKYVSSDRIMIWSIPTFCSFSGCFTSCCHICDRPNISLVTIENLRIGLTIWCYFRAIQQVLVGLRI